MIVRNFGMISLKHFLNRYGNMLLVFPRVQVQTSNSSNSMVEGLSKLLKLQKDWGSILLCLYEAGRLDRVQLLDIFCEVVNPNLQIENVLFVSKVTCENLSGLKSGCIAQVLNTIRYLPMKTLLHVLEVWAYHLKGMSEIKNRLKELESITISADSVRPTMETWARTSTASTGNGTVPLNEKVAALLQDVTRKYLVHVECLPFHEIICFTRVLPCVKY
jgi:origin recognition complex subunit 3